MIGAPVASNVTAPHRHEAVRDSVRFTLIGFSAGNLAQYCTVQYHESIETKGWK